MKPSHPSYTLVKQYVLKKIRSGRWRAGDPVPSESVLMTQFGLSRMTVHRALRELSDEGLVTRVKGSGTVVADLSHISSGIQIRDIHEEILARNHKHSTEVLLLEAVSADTLLANSLGVHLHAQLFHSVLLHRENGIAIQLEDRFINPACAPDYLSVDFNDITPTRYLLDVAPLTRAAYVIEACMPSALQAKQLGIAVSEPCLRMRRTSYSSDLAVTTAQLLYPSTRHHFGGEFQA